MTRCFVIRNFRGTYSSVKMLKGYLLILQNAEGVHAHLWECWRGTWSKKGWEPLAHNLVHSFFNRKSISRNTIVTPEILFKYILFSRFVHPCYVLSCILFILNANNFLNQFLISRTSCKQCGNQKTCMWLVMHEVKHALHLHIVYNEYPR